MSLNTSFSTRAATIGASIERYSAMYGRGRGGTLDAAEQAEFNALFDYLRGALTLDLIRPSQNDADLQEQLVNKDLVHDFGVRSIEELGAYRLGAFESSKTSFALINPQADGGKREILAAIYVYWQQSEGKPNGDYRGLSGNVHNILHQPVAASRAGQTQAAVFYSISAFKTMKGAGQMLIDMLHERMTGALDQSATLTTLSPLRGFGEWLHDHGVSRVGMDDDELRQAALAFLLHNRDGVQLFHMGNGAQIGDIKLHANGEGSKDSVMGHNVMVNYVYPRDKAEVADNRIRHERAVAARMAGDHGGVARLIHASTAPHLQAEIAQRPAPRLRQASLMPSLI